MAKKTWKAEEQRWAEEQKEPNKRWRINSEVTGKPIKGLYYRWGKQSSGEWEKIFYAAICRGDGKPIEEKIGREFTDDVSVDWAISKQKLMKGKDGEKTRREKKKDETAKAEVAASIEATRKSFDTLWAEYQEWRTSESKGRWTRQKSDQANYSKYLQVIVGSKTPAEVTDADVERIHGKMAKEPGLKGNKTLAPATRKMILALLVRIAAFGTTKKGGRCPGLVVTVELPEVDNVVTEFLTKEEQDRLGAILQAGSFVDKKGNRHEISRDAIDIVYFLLTTGMRRGEVLGIEWKNVGPEFITVPYPKEKKSKTIRINPIVADILESRKDNGSAFVFPARNWKEADAHIVDPKRSLNLIKKEAKLPADFRCAHGFRHNFGYWAVMPVEEGGAGADVVTVGATIGHASIKTTERYIKAADAAKKRLSNRMAAIFAPKELPENVVAIK